MDIREGLRLKLQKIIYPSGTPLLNETNSAFLGTTRLKDLPGQQDEFFRLWFIRFNNLTKWFWVFRDLVEELLKKKRFISYAEYQEIYKDKTVKDGKDIQVRYPVYRLLNIKNEKQRQRFVNTYPNTIEGYYGLMHKVNPELWEMYTRRHFIRLPHSETQKHTYIVGGTGSGKSELLKHLILQDIGKGEKCVILVEPNGELSEQIARQKDIAPERFVYIDCSFSPSTPSINPFEFVDASNEIELEKQSQTIYSALKQIFESEGQPITLQMLSIIMPCLEIVARQKGTLRDLQRFMISGVNEDLLEAGKAVPKFREFFERKFNESNIAPSRQGIYQKLMTLLNMSTYSGFFCGSTTVDLPRAIREKKIIIFNLSKGKVGTVASTFIGKMVIAIIQNLIFQRASMAPGEMTPLALYIDEFQDFINDSSREMFVQGRKYKVSLTVASQVVGQGMTTEMTKIVLGNTNVKFVGMNGYETLRIMSKETYTEIEELKDLTVGQFFCRIGNGQGFILTVPKKHLKWETCIDETQWSTALKYQLTQYYKARALPSPTPAPPPKKEQQKQSPPPKEPRPERKDAPEPQRPNQKRFTPKYK